MVTLLKEKGRTPPEDEQLHVLPNYVLDLSGEVDEITEPSLSSQVAAAGRPNLPLEHEITGLQVAATGRQNYLLDLSREAAERTGTQVG